MSMATLGAREESLDAALALFGREPFDVAADMRGFDRYLASLSDNVQMTITNAAWVNRNFVLNPDVERALSNYFDVAFNRTFFSGQMAIDNIDGWISDQTNGLIPDFFRLSCISPGTRALHLTNVIHITADSIHDICDSFLWLQSLDKLENSEEKLDVDWPYTLTNHTIEWLISPHNRGAFIRFYGLINLEESRIAGDVNAPIFISSISMRQRVRILEAESGIEVAIVTNVRLSVQRSHPQIPMTVPQPN